MFKAAKDIGKYIGGRMHKWAKGDVIDMDRETVMQNFEPGDYESETVDDYKPVGLGASKKKTEK